MEKHRYLIISLEFSADVGALNLCSWQTVRMKRGRDPDCSFITSQLSANRGPSLSYLAPQWNICLWFLPLSSQLLIIHVIEESINVNNTRPAPPWPLFPATAALSSRNGNQLAGEVRLKTARARPSKLTLFLLPLLYLPSEWSPLSSFSGARGRLPERRCHLLD